MGGVRCLTASGLIEAPTTTRSAWVTKLTGVKSPPYLRGGRLMIRLHMLQKLVCLLKDFTLDWIESLKGDFNKGL